MKYVLIGIIVFLIGSAIHQHSQKKHTYGGNRGGTILELRQATLLRK